MVVETPRQPEGFVDDGREGDVMISSLEEVEYVIGLEATELEIA